MIHNFFGSSLVYHNSGKLPLPKLDNSKSNCNTFYTTNNNAHIAILPTNMTKVIKNEGIPSDISFLYQSYFCDIYNRLDQFPNQNIDEVAKDHGKSFIAKNPFTKIEDKILISLVNVHGPRKWQKISLIMKKLNFNRNGRQCRDRYFHYLSPQINNDAEWSSDDDELLLKSVKEKGKKWKSFERLFKGRTEVSIRNRYNLLIRKEKKEIKKKQKSNQITNKIENKKESDAELKNDTNDALFNFEMFNDDLGENTDTDSSFDFNCDENSIIEQFYF